MRRTLAAFAFACASAAPNLAHAQSAGSIEGGYVGSGNLVVQTSLAGVALTVGGNIALEERGSRLRIDVLSLGIPGADPTVSAVLGTQLFPPGGFSVVYDAHPSTYTVWTNAKRAFFVGGTPDRAQPAAANPAAGAIASGADLFDAFSALRSLKNDRVFSASVALIGHETLFGHPVTGLHYQFTQSTSADASFDAQGELELADDLGSVPIEFTARATAKGIPGTSLRLDLTQMARQTPRADDFAPPRGYVRASTLGDVIGGKISL
ncbi:MAG: hypothetical protein IAI49_06160 [Candidatus Eremiobacteraeota bacterium]|nr:hypothetical protein [Candidatus Eremiobacteraeota bacterium]